MTGVTPDDQRGESGSASIWVLSCAVLLLLVAAVTGTRALALLARHRAESAADLAALAAAGRIGFDDGYCAAAAEVARRNGTLLARCRPKIDGDGRAGSVVVAVRLTVSLPLVGHRFVTASARAGRSPVAGISREPAPRDALWHAGFAGPARSPFSAAHAATTRTVPETMLDR